jgi:hypothetical protein
MEYFATHRSTALSSICRLHCRRPQSTEIRRDFLLLGYNVNYFSYCQQENFLLSKHFFHHPRGVIMVVIIWRLDLQLPVQSVPITTKVVSSNPVHGEVYSIQHYVIKFASDLRYVGDFLHQ